MVDVTRTAYWCSACESEYFRVPDGRVCLDCEAVLVDGSGVEVPVEVPFDEDAEEVGVDRFETDNPWLQRLFSDPSYGTVPAAAPALLRAVSPDPEEFLIAAISTRHGSMRYGYLLVTTTLLRWVQTLPMRDQDYWSYDYALDLKGGPLMGALVTTVDGRQFQTRWGKAKPFVERYRLMQQALAWEASQSVAPAALPPPAAIDLADQLARLADLHRQGALDAIEFSAAKARLLAP